MDNEAIEKLEDTKLAALVFGAYEEDVPKIVMQTIREVYEKIDQALALLRAKPPAGELEPNGTAKGEYMHESIEKDAVKYDLPSEEIITLLATDNRALKARLESEVAKNKELEAELADIELELSTPETAECAAKKEPLYKWAATIVCAKHQLEAENKRLKSVVEQAIETMGSNPVQANGEWEDGINCGLEDRNITDRYEACRYGYDKALEKVQEWIIDELEQALKDTDGK